VSILTLDGVHTAYGPTRVLHGLSLALDEGEALAVLGRNGAGKTTLLKTIIGLVPVQAGTISLAGAGDITRVPSHRRARLGIGYVPQGRRLFPRLTVAENIRMGTTVRPEGPDEKVLDAIYEAFPKLAERREQKAGTLSGGEQQMVAFGRAIAMSPRVLLLDEPSEGLAPVVVDALIDAVVNLSKWLGFGILIVEQNVAVAFEAARRTIVLERGAIVREGTPDELRHDADLTRILAI
jgi:ABC-type branched-subunit amino acid transport system ATPase component